ncbi:MAG TPA: thioredoxin family protein [Candidatus Moranbacteria bacterium]|nr:thioredoxin family protein [Candidatus Moranbacteria bacterium]
MKNILAFFIILTLNIVNLEAQDKKIHFEKLRLKEAVIKAKLENKLIFIDVYTNWCGPCRWMSQNVFTDPKVAKYFNQKFISIKANAEHGIGISYANKFNVRSYPSLIFLDQDGDVLKRVVGSRPASEFLSLAMHIGTPLSKELKKWKLAYENNSKSPELLFAYANALLDLDEKIEAKLIAQQYLASQEDWRSSKNIDFIYKFSPLLQDTKVFEFITNNRDAFIPKYPKQEIDRTIRNYLHAIAFQNKAESDFETEVEKLYQQYFTEDLEQYLAEFQLLILLEDASQTADHRAFFERSISYFENYNCEECMILDLVTKQFALYADQEELLIKAKEWANKSIAQHSGFANNLNLAIVLFRLKKNQEAMKFANTAIEIAKKENQKFEEANNLIALIEAKIIKK